MSTFFKNWTLPIAIICGIIAYFVYAALPLPAAVRHTATAAVETLQPLLIFSMLFLSFCKTDIRRLRLRRSHGWLLLFQCGLFVVSALVLHFLPMSAGAAVVTESAMLCLICPTATAAAVVTQKLGGDAADVTMYTLLINLAAALVVPLCVPLIYPHHSGSFYSAFALIISKVFPLLIFPLLTAQFVRFCLPGLHRRVVKFHNLAFYLWAVALCLAIAVTTHSIAVTHHPLVRLAGIALASLACCVVQFWFGRRIGRRAGRLVSTSQALGQKNTVFAIWLGYTYLNPATSLAGGFYSIWHNLYNTWQLRQTPKN